MPRKSPPPASQITEAKRVAGRQNAAIAAAAARKPIEEIPCGCRVSDAEMMNPDAHLRSCLRRRALLRRIAQAEREAQTSAS